MAAGLCLPVGMTGTSPTPVTCYAVVCQSGRSRNLEDLGHYRMKLPLKCAPVVSWSCGLNVAAVRPEPLRGGERISAWAGSQIGTPLRATRPINLERCETAQFDMCQRLSSPTSDGPIRRWSKGRKTIPIARPSPRIDRIGSLPCSPLSQCAAGGRGFAATTTRGGCAVVPWLANIGHANRVRVRNCVIMALRPLIGCGQIGTETEHVG